MSQDSSFKPRSFENQLLNVRSSSTEPVLTYSPSIILSAFSSSSFSFIISLFLRSTSTLHFPSNPSFLCSSSYILYIFVLYTGFLVHYKPSFPSLPAQTLLSLSLSLPVQHLSASAHHLAFSSLVYLHHSSSPLLTLLLS